MSSIEFPAVFIIPANDPDIGDVWILSFCQMDAIRFNGPLPVHVGRQPIWFSGRSPDEIEQSLTWGMNTAANLVLVRELAREFSSVVLSPPSSQDPETLAWIDAFNARWRLQSFADFLSRFDMSGYSPDELHRAVDQFIVTRVLSS